MRIPGSMPQESHSESRIDPFGSGAIFDSRIGRSTCCTGVMVCKIRLRNGSMASKQPGGQFEGLYPLNKLFSEPAPIACR